MKSAPLKVAWLIIWKTAATTATVKIESLAPLLTARPTAPSKQIIKATSDTVEKASTPFKSSCLTALKDAQSKVNRPTSRINHTHSSLKAKTGVNLATK